VLILETEVLLLPGILCLYFLLNIWKFSPCNDAFNYIRSRSCTFNL